MKSRKRWAREYHSKARVEWVKGWTCIVPGCENTPCDNHHTENAGMSAKGPYQSIVLLCAGYRGHHRMLHTIGRLTFERLTGINLKEEAADVERRWKELNNEQND